MSKYRLGNKKLIRDINMDHVIKEIRANGPLSRTQISKNTSLGLSTITKICDELIHEGLIYDIGEGVSTGGRKPINLLFNNRYGYIIGIKIENEKVIMALTDLEPSIITIETYKYKKKSSFEVVKPILLKGIDNFTKKIKELNSQLLGIGIAISGVIDPVNNILISSVFLGWYNIDFKEVLKDYGVNVYVDNDVNCYTLAQKWLGKGQDSKNFACVTIGEGIGAGIIINNMLYRGFIGGAGEIGHMIIDKDGKQCFCGQQGCLETCASEDFIINYIKEKTGREYTIEDIVKMANDNNFDCVEAFKTAGRNIGYSLINLIMILNPEKIIIGGKGLQEKDFIISEILTTIDKNWFSQIGIKTKLEIDKIGNDYFLLGAAILVLSELIKVPIYKKQRTLLNNVFQSE